MGMDPPSGAWKGYWTYSHSPQRRKQRMDLKFAAARMMGDGDDEVGYFCINGKYDSESGAVSWIKTYPKSHQVMYSGRWDGIMITGSWRIESAASGNFAIWPGDTEEGAADRQHIEESLPEPAKTKG